MSPKCFLLCFPGPCGHSEIPCYGVWIRRKSFLVCWKKCLGLFPLEFPRNRNVDPLRFLTKESKKKKTFQQTSRGKFFWGSKCHNRPEIKDIFLWIIVKVPRKHFYFQKRRKSKGLSINKRYGFRSNVVLQKYKVLLLTHPFLWIWIHFFKDFFVV